MVHGGSFFVREFTRQVFLKRCGRRALDLRRGLRKGCQTNAIPSPYLSSSGVKLAAGRSRAAVRNPTQKPIPKSLINWDQHPYPAGVPMRNRDFVSDAFLALIATGLVLLCSSLLAIALR
jgi:hypothetical protein